MKFSIAKKTFKNYFFCSKSALANNNKWHEKDYYEPRCSGEIRKFANETLFSVCTKNSLTKKTLKGIPSRTEGKSIKSGQNTQSRRKSRKVCSGILFPHPDKNKSAGCFPKKIHPKSLPKHYFWRLRRQFSKNYYTHFWDFRNFPRNFRRITIHTYGFSKISWRFWKNYYTHLWILGIFTKFSGKN